MIADILIFALGVVVTAMTILAVAGIGQSEAEDPAHGTSVNDVNDDASEPIPHATR